MALYYKFKSAKDYDSVPIDGHFISVLNLKEKIFESKHLGRGTDFDLVITNAQTNEEYLDEDTLIPKNTSVLIRRIPGQRIPIVTHPEMTRVENESEVPESEKGGLFKSESVPKHPEDFEWDEFGNDLYEIPEAFPVPLSSNPIVDAPPPSRDDEDSKIKALVDTPALDWQFQASDNSGGGRGFGRGLGGRMGGRGFGRGGFERKTPAQGYVCFRCHVPGHYIKHCPTNGDPNYDPKRVKPPTGIPRSMLMATPDGSYALPSGEVAVLKPNEAAFEKEIEGIPSSRPVGDLPPELHCPLCKEVMKDAVLTSKCCFNSFCDKCIRDHVISKSSCVCGATNILADDLLPNKTLRDTINRILESNNSSAENAGSAFQVQDMESARCPPPRASSPNMSAASMGERPPHLHNEKASTVKGDEGIQASEKGKMGKGVDASEATHESMSAKEQALQPGAPLVEDEVLQKGSAEPGKKKKKKKARLPMNDALWKGSPDMMPESLMMPSGPAYNSYWGGMQPGMDSYMGAYAGPMPFANYGFGPLDMPYPGIMPPDPFSGQGYVLPGVAASQRDLAGFAMGLNAGPAAMSREEFEARKADLRRKREVETRGDTEDRGLNRGMSSNGMVSTSHSKSRATPPTNSSDHRRSSPERSHRRLSEQSRPLKRKPGDDHPNDDRRDSHRRQCDNPRRRSESNRPPSVPSAADTHRSEPRRAATDTHRSESKKPPSVPSAAETVTGGDRNHKNSVFSRISYPEEGAPSKKRKASPPEPGAAASPSLRRRGLANGHHDERKSSARESSSGKKDSAADCESSGEDRHFKRKGSTYERARARAVSPNRREEGRGRQSKGSSRKRERGGGSAREEGRSKRSR